jgi:hypothetical protein
LSELIVQNCKRLLSLNQTFLIGSTKELIYIHELNWIV